MICGLKVALILFGAIIILLGLALIVVPNQAAASMFSLGGIADYIPYIMAMCGISFIAPSVWLIVAGRDPL